MLLFEVCLKLALLLGVVQRVASVADSFIVQEQGVDGIDVVLNSLSALPRHMASTIMCMLQTCTPTQMFFVMMLSVCS